MVQQLNHLLLMLTIWVYSHDAFSKPKQPTQKMPFEAYISKYIILINNFKITDIVLDVKHKELIFNIKHCILKNSMKYLYYINCLCVEWLTCAQAHKWAKKNIPVVILICTCEIPGMGIEIWTRFSVGAKYHIYS